MAVPRVEPTTTLPSPSQSSEPSAWLRLRRVPAALSGIQTINATGTTTTTFRRHTVILLLVLWVTYPYCHLSGSRVTRTYPYRKAHPILRWLPSKLADNAEYQVAPSQYLAETMAADQPDLGIPVKQGAKWTVAELNSILAKNLVPGQDGNHLLTFSTLQWESDDYRGRPKALYYRHVVPCLGYRLAKINKHSKSTNIRMK